MVKNKKDSTAAVSSNNSIATSGKGKTRKPSATKRAGLYSDLMPSMRKRIVARTGGASLPKAVGVYVAGVFEYLAAEAIAHAAVSARHEWNTTRNAKSDKKYKDRKTGEMKDVKQVDVFYVSASDLAFSMKEKQAEPLAIAFGFPTH
jgi:hypothetical protein